MLSVLSDYDKSQVRALKSLQPNSWVGNLQPAGQNQPTDVVQPAKV